MTNSRGWVLVLTLFLAGVIETTWITLLSLPGAIPPLVMVFVLGFASRRIPLHAAVIGFATGLFMDLLPPSSTPLGTTAVSFAIVGFLYSGLRPFIEGSAFLPVASIAVLAVVSYAIRIVVSSVSGGNANLTDNLVGNAVSTSLYAALLTIAVIPLAQLVDRYVQSRTSSSIVR